MAAPPGRPGLPAGASLHQMVPRRRNLEKPPSPIIYPLPSLAPWRLSPSNIPWEEEVLWETLPGYVAAPLRPAPSPATYPTLSGVPSLVFQVTGCRVDSYK